MVRNTLIQYLYKLSMGILDRHTHEDGTEHEHEEGSKSHEHDECTCKSNKGRDINCAVTEHSG